MALLGTFTLGGALDKVLAAGDTDAPRIQSAITKLKENPRDAMSKILKEIESGPKLHYSTALKLLSMLLDNTTISIVIQALPSLNTVAQKDIAAILNRSNQYDPHTILPYLKSPLSLQISRDLLTAHRREFKAAKLLRQVVKIDSELWDTIFELVHASVDEPALAEANLLSQSKDPKIRELVIGVIAEFNNPAAQESLLSFLNDESGKVRLAALRGLVRIRANLPVANLLELMKSASKEEATYVKALIGHSKDPELINQFTLALLSKNAKLKPLAIVGLAQLMSTQTLRNVFEAIAEKPQPTIDSILNSLHEAAKKKYSLAVSELINDYSPEIKTLAGRALLQLDPEDEIVATAMATALGENLADDIMLPLIELQQQIQSPDAVDPLINILKGRNTEMYAPTLKALRGIADARALAPVFESLNEQDAEIQKAALKCLVAVTPEQFASKMRDQLIEQSNHLETDALETLVDTLRAFTKKFNLRITTNYQKTLDKLNKDASGEFEMPMSLGGAAASDPGGDPFSSDADNPFGGKSDGVFGSAQQDSPMDTEGDPAMDFAIDLEEGLILGDRYELIREIGRGGYGSVWLIKDSFIKEEMVMKFLHQQLVSDDVAIERFIRELRLARKITHKNIIRLFDYLDLGNISAISMEYFDGKPLSNWLHESTMEPEDVVKIMITVCHALQNAHDEGVIHRDMKPANILINDQHDVKIVDFGIAAASKHAESRLTRTGTLIGTPTYISPEQIQGKEIDPRTDIYSLGIIMYEMLAGHPPYQAEDPMALIFLHVEGDARPINDANPLVSQELANVVHRCIKPDPEDRFASMEELAKALHNLQL